MMRVTVLIDFDDDKALVTMDLKITTRTLQRDMHDDDGATDER
jgi:hypothetical protein